MVGTYIERDTASDFVNTGGDIETTTFVKVMNRTSSGSVYVSLSIAKNAIERLKWITEITELNGLDWEDGIYTWEFEVKTPNGNLCMVEVILRRLSCDGARVKASKSSSISVDLGTPGLKIGTIVWNDGTQNPASKGVDDRLEIVFRIKNVNKLSSESIEIGTNSTNNMLFFATPISGVVSTSIHNIIDASKSVQKVRDSVAIIGQIRTSINSIFDVIDNHLTKLRTMSISNSKSVTRLRSIIPKMGNFAQSLYERRRILRVVEVQFWDLLNTGKKSTARLVTNMQTSYKNLIRLYEKVQLTRKILTHRLQHNTIPYVIAGVKQRITLTRDEWTASFRMEFNEIVEASHLPVSVKSKLRKSALARKKQASAYYTLPMLRPDGDEDMKAKIKGLELENFNLRQELRKLRYRGPRGISMILASTGIASLIVSYLYSSLILTFIGLGLTLWSVVIFCVLPSKHVPADIFDAMSLHWIKTLDNLLVSLGYKGRPIFHHPKYLGDLAQGYVFVPYDGLHKVPKDQELSLGKLFYDEPRGISIVAPSQGLVELFERELNIKFASVDLEYLKENLPRLLVEDLRLIDDISMEYSKGSIQVRIVGRSCAHVCDAINKQTRLGSHLGCPLCSSIALVISKVTGKPVMISESSVKNDSVETNYLMLDA
jgi:hypothetical protein